MKQKRVCIALVIAMISITTSGQNVKTMKVESPIVSEKDFVWYVEQKEAWKKETQQNPRNENAWLNYYHAAHYMGWWGTNSDSIVREVISEMKQAILCYIMLPPCTLTSEHGIFYEPPKGVRLELMNQFTEARHESSTKWRGIELLINHEGANLDDVITFGDGPNDIDMLEHAKTGVAVGKSPDKVKEAADYVCDDIDNGGILKACKYLGLI